jgi:DNA-binding CsgD family transcriptional regulator
MKRPSRIADFAYRVRPAGGGETAMDGIAQFYELTAAERRVLSAVLDTGGVRGVAIALDVSEATIKTHLQNIFGKTGVRRQIDLVKLVIAGAFEPRKKERAIRRLVSVGTRAAGKSYESRNRNGRGHNSSRSP